MPGICGIITKKRGEGNQSHLQFMLDSMLHEPFYRSGSYSNDGLGIYAGWVCHEGSFSDCMPVWNEKKTVILLFFGENFTDLELFDQLKAKHHKFDSSNASYIVHLYEEKGIGFLTELNGWFSGLLVDLRSNTAVLFNDRYGMQRIYYYEGKDSFYFSSEAKALLEICPDRREIDPRGLGEYISCDCVLENRTLFRGIHRLPGAAAWIFEGDAVLVKDCYFKSEGWENQPWLEKDFYYERLKETFTKVLSRYFRTSQPIGISLTGGLDTRVLMAVSIDMPPGKYPCYTFGGMYRDCYDVKVARKVAEVCHQSHETLVLDKAFLSDFPSYAEKVVNITDGCVGVAGSYELYLNNLARQIAPIRMTGNYGGEVLRGIGGMLRARVSNPIIFSSDMTGYFREAASTVHELYEGCTNEISFNFFKEIPWLRSHNFVSEQSQLTLRSPYLDNDLVALTYRAPLEARQTKELCLRLIADGNPELGTIPTDRGVGGNERFLFSSLARGYYEFLFKAEYAYNYGMPQWLAKLDSKVMGLHLEKLFFGRHKFAHYRVWYRDELSDYVKAMLLDDISLSRTYLNRKAVEQIVVGHTRGYANYTTEISKLLTLELIHRLLTETDS